MQEEASDISLDSVASTTASDVLIGSTSVHRTGSLRKEASGGGEDTSQGMMDLLDVGMVAARNPDSSAVSGGCREQRQRDTSTAQQDILHVSEVASHKGFLQGSMSRGSHGEAAWSQEDADRSTVRVSAKRLREIPAPIPDFTAKKRDPSYVPPALPANKYPAVRFTFMEEAPDAVSGSSVQKNRTSKNSRSPKVLVTKHFLDDTNGHVVKKKTHESIRQKNKEVQISQFTTGQKKSLLAALNTRVQSGPVTKEVRVQLLKDAVTSSKKSTGSADEKAGHIEVQSATIAAVTAAAIAATAPVLKAQSDLEVQVNSVSQLLNKLQEADRQLPKLTEQPIKIQSQPSERLYHQERVSELEKQLGQLTEQRLQHLEKLQQQQLEMQSHFIRTTVKASANPPEPSPVCTHVSSAVPKPQSLYQPLNTAPPRNSNQAAVSLVAETRDSGKSPLETPAPRRFAPQPITMDVQPPPKTVLGKENVKESENVSNAGKIHFLQQILGHDGTPLPKSSYTTHNPLNLSKIDSQPFSSSFFQRDGVTTRTNVTSSTAVQKADDVLQDLNTLKQEMQKLVKDAKQWTSQAEDLKPRVSSIMTSAPVFAPHSFTQSAVNLPKSRFEDAKRILREVQNRKKIFEDNLEAINRARDGTAWHSLISALTTDGDISEKMRIQRTVDCWISKMDSEIQDKLASEDIRKKKPEDRVQEPSLRRNAGSGKDLKNNRDREIKGPARDALRSTKPSTGVSAKVQPKLGAGKLTGQQSRASLNKGGKSKAPQIDESFPIDEEALNRVYGTPVYQGHRSTLKKGPYLRFNSPSPKSKPRRPKVVETVKGVKLKSTKMQTNSPETEIAIARAKAPEFSVAKEYSPQYLFIPYDEANTSSVPMEGQLIQVAIPLGKPRICTTAAFPSTVTRTRPHPVIVNVSVPPQSPQAQPKVVKPNIAVVEVKSEKKEPPQLSVQVLPCVDIDSIASDSPSTSERTPSAEFVPPTPSPVQPDIQLPVNVETEEEILALPGTSYEAPDFSEEEEEDEALLPPTLMLELSGRGETHVTQHDGIPFPPAVPPLQTITDIPDRNEALVNKLISWVEQEVIARVINERHPVTTSVDDQSTSDGGVPVDSSLIRNYVEEALAEIIATILREIRAVPTHSLEQPDVQPGPDEIASVPTPQSTPPASPLPSPREKSIMKTPEPVPTPQSTPPASPLPSAREPSIVKTPELSPQTSVEEPDVHQEELDDHEKSLPVKVDTPTITPAPSPPKAATPTPVLSKENEEPPAVQASPPNPWGEIELPLEEENPHSLIEAVEFKDAAVMTVAVEEEPRSLISAASSEKSLPMSPKQRTPSPVPSPPVSAPSTDESSLTVTVTESDTTDKPLSEGEIVYSYGQIAVARALAEGGVVYPNLTESLSSTLRDANDMEFDPPSEGQVIQGPHRGAHRDPILSLLAKFNQDLVAPHEAFYHLESSGEDNSLGEISEGQRPKLTMTAEQVLVGHSVFMDRPSNVGQTAGRPLNRPSSPGQCTNVPGGDDADNISSGPMSIRDLDAQLLPVHYPHADNPYQTPSVPRNTSQGPGQPQKEHQPVPTRFIQVGVKSAEDLHQVIQGTHEDTDRTLVEPSVYLSPKFSGEASRPTKNIPVTLPTMGEADEEVKTSFVKSDSSDADSF
ncbi:protein TALPID3 isoform X2 [Aquarana catesbeiana]|uniref:protein TALPID3 isoform X2 n=1 Tax=Aquarana catesbeiana TaxID=8400 RepID=UPI003CC96921